MANQRTEAEALASCLELELIDVQDAVAWADAQIAASDIPHIALCDVAMASRAYRVDVASMLRQLPGKIDSAWVVRRIVECCLEGLRSARVAPRTIASALCQLAMAGTLPPGKLRSDAWWFFRALDLANDGYIQESRKEIVKRMHNSLEDALAQLSQEQKGRQLFLEDE